MKSKKSPACMGRPRAFDFDKALERAMEVFWDKGYEGASLSDLTEAMGINRPSLYGAFGNKEELFLKALDRYTEGPAAFVREALAQPTGRLVAEHLLYGTADAQTGCHRGCLAVQGALSSSKEGDPIRKELIARRRALEAQLSTRFDRARSEGDLPKSCNPEELARYITAVTQGMAVQSVGGATRKELQSVIEIALQAWPK